MCEQDQFEKDRQEFEARGQVTRRQFGVLLGAGVAMMLPRVVDAVTVTESDVNISRRRTAPATPTSCTRPAAPLQACSYGPTSSGGGRRCTRWPNGSPSRATQCWW